MRTPPTKELPGRSPEKQTRYVQSNLLPWFVTRPSPLLQSTSSSAPKLLFAQSRVPLSPPDRRRAKARICPRKRPTYHKQLCTLRRTAAALPQDREPRAPAQFWERPPLPTTEQSQAAPAINPIVRSNHGSPVQLAQARHKSRRTRARDTSPTGSVKRMACHCRNRISCAAKAHGLGIASVVCPFPTSEDPKPLRLCASRKHRRGGSTPSQTLFAPTTFLRTHSTGTRCPSRAVVEAFPAMCHP
jgi:hypothetical protein